jgi:hypothetical protein
MIVRIIMIHEKNHVHLDIYFIKIVYLFLSFFLVQK